MYVGEVGGGGGGGRWSDCVKLQHTCLHLCYQICICTEVCVSDRDDEFAIKLNKPISYLQHDGVAALLTPVYGWKCDLIVFYGVGTAGTT